MDPYLKEIERALPNDQNLGAAVRDYIQKNKECCNMKVNQIEHKTLDAHSCKACGKLTFKNESTRIKENR